MLLKLSLDKSEGEPCTVNRHVELFQEIRQTAYMVLVTVGEHNAAELIYVFLNIAVIGKDDIHAQKLAIGESHTTVYDQHIVCTFDSCTVLSYLVESAKRDYLHGSFP